MDKIELYLIYFCVVLSIIISILCLMMIFEEASLELIEKIKQKMQSLLQIWSQIIVPDKDNWATDPRDTVVRRVTHTISVELDNGRVVKLIDKNEPSPVDRTVDLACSGVPICAIPTKVLVSDCSTSPRGTAFVCELPLLELDDSQRMATGAIVNTKVDTTGIFTVDFEYYTVEHKMTTELEKTRTMMIKRMRILMTGTVIPTATKQANVTGIPFNVYAGLGPLRNAFFSKLPASISHGNNNSLSIPHLVDASTSVEKAGKLFVAQVQRSFNTVIKEAAAVTMTKAMAATTVRPWASKTSKTGEMLSWRPFYASQHSADLGKKDSRGTRTAAVVKQTARTQRQHHVGTDRKKLAPTCHMARRYVDRGYVGVLGKRRGLTEKRARVELPLYAPASLDGVSAGPEKEPSTGDDGIMASVGGTRDKLNRWVRTMRNNLTGNGIVQDTVLIGVIVVGCACVVKKILK